VINHQGFPRANSCFNSYGVSFVIQLWAIFLSFVSGRNSSIEPLSARIDRSVVCRPIVPSRSDRYKRAGPCQNLWRPTQCPPSCIPLVRGRTCDGWRIAAASRWWSWYTAARNCWTVREQEIGMRISFFLSFASLHLLVAPSWRFCELFVLFLLKDTLHTSIDQKRMIKLSEVSSQCNLHVC